MSIASLIVEPTRIQALVDTQARFGAATIDVAKIALLPHHDGVVVGHGAHLVIAGICAAMLAAPLTFDDLVDMGLQICDGIFANLRGQLRPEAGHNHVALAGWSRAGGAFMMAQFEQNDGARFRRPQASRFFVAPWDRSIERLCRPQTLADFVALGIAQVDLMHRLAPDAAAGGRLIHVEVRRGGAMVRTLHTFDPGGIDAVEIIDAVESIDAVPLPKETR